MIIIYLMVEAFKGVLNLIIIPPFGLEIYREDGVIREVAIVVEAGLSKSLEK